MSSYELMELLEYMPEEGAFKRALRDGEYSENEIVWRHVASELSKLRATMHAVHGGERYAPRVFMTLGERREMDEADARVEEARESVYSFADMSSDAFQKALA